MALNQIDWYKWTDRLAYASFLITVFTIAVSLILGLLAAIVGRSFTALGRGAGGAWGIPDLILTVVMLLALPSFIGGFVALFRTRSHALNRMLAYIFPLIISGVYLIVAHGLDPCLSGVWDSASKVGAVALCERFGIEFNVHTRFHLLWHVIPTLPLVGLYWLFMMKRFPDQRWLSPSPSLEEAL